jgi:hypothetical protein
MNAKELLEQGRNLETKIMAQRERCYLAPFNQQESRQLDKLQEQWVRFEETASQTGIDIEREFPKIEWLRPPKRPSSLKKSYNIAELVLIPIRLKRARFDLNTVGGSHLWDIGF